MLRGVKVEMNFKPLRGALGKPQAEQIRFAGRDKLGHDRVEWQKPAAQSMSAA
jgi:hypothetical protein